MGQIKVEKNVGGIEGLCVMKTKKRIKIGIATTFVIVILMSLCGSRFVF